MKKKIQMNSDLGACKQVQCVWVSSKIPVCNFGPQKAVCDRKMKGRHNQGECLVAMGMVSGRLSSCWCLNKEGRMITRTKFVWHSKRLWEGNTYTHKGFSIHFLVSYKWSEYGGRRSPPAGSPVSTFSHQSRFNDRSAFEDIDKSIKK